MPKKKNTPARKTMCSTCPFREGSPTECLKSFLIEQALTVSSRICHSTGGNTVIHPRSKTNVPAQICRGARDVQLQLFHSLGILEAPTDEAWNKSVELMEKRKRKRK